MLGEEGAKTPSAEKNEQKETGDDRRHHQGQMDGGVRMILPGNASARAHKRSKCQTEGWLVAAMAILNDSQIAVHSAAIVPPNWPALRSGFPCRRGRLNFVDVGPGVQPAGSGMTKHTRRRRLSRSAHAFEIVRSDEEAREAAPARGRRLSGAFKAIAHKAPRGTVFSLARAGTSWDFRDIPLKNLFC